MKLKKRLDACVQDHYPQYSRNQIQSFIMQGKVMVNGACVTKPGVSIGTEAQVVVMVDEPKYVCRAGWKLEKALDHFALNLEGLVALDAGLSTGGFTDCLLQRGIHHVYGIDVGYGQVHEKIRRDARVTVKERTNLRYLETVGEKVDLITLDLSFISLLKVMDAVQALLKDTGQLITLIKPQFEAQRREVTKGGIIKDLAVHERVIKEVIAGIERYGFRCQGVIESPIHGTCGNKEFLAYFKHTP
jgi:23S rRNA (cytidine1920-2'-O)/16S rRNA (cytidine1409-2'-O)-methyltransferase